MPAGLLLGYGVLMSYGMPLMGLVALAVLVAARSWRPLPVALRRRWRSCSASRPPASRGGTPTRCCGSATTTAIAQDRPQDYWWYGDLAALVVSAGPLLLPGLAAAARPVVAAFRVPLLLVGATVARRGRADASGMSKAEVERIWLPFVPWLTVSFALLPEGWRQVGARRPGGRGSGRAAPLLHGR